MAHEALDRRHAATLGIAHAGGELALDVEGQAFLGAPGDVVEVAAHRPQEVFRLDELAQFDRGQQPLADKIGDAVDLIGKLADPEQRVEIAQAALALFQIGLDDIAAVAHPPVARVALAELVGDEGARVAGDDFLAEPHARRVVKRLVTPYIARLEQRGAGRQVGLRHADHVVQGPRRVADLEAEVPQQMENRLDHLLAPRRLLEGREEQQVDI